MKIMMTEAIALIANFSEENIENLVGTIRLTREEFWQTMSNEDPQLMQILQEESPTLERWNFIQPEFTDGQMYVKINNLPLLIQLLKLIQRSKTIVQEQKKEKEE